MSRHLAGPRRFPLRSALLILLACAAIGISAWSAGFYPAMASMMGLSSTAIPTHSQSYAQVVIPKPTYTFSPAALPSPTPANPIEAISTPSLIRAEIVPDTPIPEFSANTDGNPFGPPVDSSYGGSKYILVDISEQHLYAYEGDGPIYSFVASTGLYNATATGRFSVLSKIPNAYGSTWNIWMPNWLGIYYAGGLENGIHALPILPNGAQIWEGYLGTPISYGCVVLGAYESQLLYEWAEIGVPVEIRW
jgi:lipoprotein-anchoring transpeptidase ErfK/SrfK